MEQEKILALKNVLKEYGYKEELENIEQLKEDFLILTDEEAEALAFEALENLVDDMGYSIFNINIENYIDIDYFKDYYIDYFNNYVNDLEAYEPERLDEEMETAGVENTDDYVEYLVNSIDDYIEDYKECFGREGLDDFLRYNPDCIDKNRLFDDIILNDGRGHILSSYDGIEWEECIGNTYYYIYRIN